MLDKLMLALIVIGGLNWGCIGLFGFDFIGALFGGQLAIVSRIIFSLVGIAALWSISFYFHRNNSFRTAD